ncbi:aminoacyl-tRNA hydrolase [Lentisphaera profundi]|uniref:Peptidyl-tRNA hydrolase n=1 Tax=Lentisphaera profundi TaxID=1658616 RepID=A0ABY7VUY5_9BACT|nr:aminoacyl-tRNA hydrolase [Lentisphaera profundi]WDE98030.1 aminoacyl-tRNA hydrolase [Lentisphaera profundi]
MNNRSESAPKTYLVCGLGNPGSMYENTRHNVGFKAIDVLLERFSLVVKKKWRAEYAECEYEGDRYIFMKPMDYMNNSGEAIKKFAKKNSIKTEDIIVIYDEMSIKVGRLRLRLGGSAGGHNGVKSILQYFGGADFYRIRIGVDHPGKGADIADYVLSDFTLSEKALISPAVFASADAALMLCTKGCDAAMNTFNGTVPSVSSQPNQETKK